MIDKKELRQVFFKEHVEKDWAGMTKIATAPHDLFEWFYKHLSLSDVGQSLPTGAEIETASFDYATKMSNAPDKETPDWIQADFKAGVKWAIEQLSK